MSVVLIAMFSPSSSNTIAYGLKNRGVDILEATDPKRMSKLFKEYKIDLLVISINKNETALVDFLKVLRESESYKNLPIIVVMDKTNMAEVEGMFGAGADECISKPFKLAQLLAKVESLLNRGDEIKTKSRVPEEIENVFEQINSSGRVLGDVAEIFSGISIVDHKARRYSKPGPEWSEMIPKESVKPYELSGDLEYVMLRRHLVRHIPAQREYDVAEKVLIRNDLTPISAVVDHSRRVFSSDIYGIQTVKGFSCATLCCILNSRYANLYYNYYRPPKEGVGGTYFGKKALLALPLIVPTNKEQLALGKLCMGLQAVNSVVSGGAVDRVRLSNEINRMVFDIFGFDSNAIKVVKSLRI